MKRKYLLEDLMETPVRTGVLFLQILVATVLFSLAIGRSFHQTEYKTIVNSLGDKHGMYYLLDRTDNTVLDEEVINNPSAQPKLLEFYQYLMEGDVKTMSFYSMPVLEHTGDENSIVQILHVNERFWELYELKTEQGVSLFSLNGSKKDGDGRLPVVLGSAYASRCQVGDRFSEQFFVKAFLKPGQFYINPSASPDILPLDAVAICPIVIPPGAPGGEYAPAILSSVVFTDRTEVMNEIVKKSNDLGLFTLSYRSYAQQLENIMEDLRFQVELSSFVLAALVSLSALGLVSAIMEFIESHKREFTIHLLCGASRREIFLRVLCPVGVFLLLSNLFSLLLFRSGPVFLYTALFSLGLGGLISILPCVKLGKMDFNAALRKE